MAIIGLFFYNWLKNRTILSKLESRADELYLKMEGPIDMVTKEAQQRLGPTEKF